MFRLSLAVLLAGTAVATAQPKAKADPKAQLEAAVSKTLGGAPDTSYVVVLVTETMDNGGALKAGATVLDIITVPLRAMFWVVGSNSPLPWASPAVESKSSWEAEVAVFADRKSAAEAIAAFGLAEQVPGKARTWRLLKKAEGQAATAKLADTEQAKLEKQAKANAKLTVSRRPDPAKK